MCRVCLWQSFKWNWRNIVYCFVVLRCIKATEARGGEEQSDLLHQPSCCICMLDSFFSIQIQQQVCADFKQEAGWPTHQGTKRAVTAGCVLQKHQLHAERWLPPAEDSDPVTAPSHKEIFRIVFKHLLQFPLVLINKTKLILRRLEKQELIS